MNVRKSDGSIEEFDIEKVKVSICRAYEQTGEKCDEVLLDVVSRSFYIYDNITTKEIRRQVEEWLMSVNKKVAKTYIENSVSDDEMKKRSDFITNYINAENASTGSKYDSNANVATKNIATLNAEIPKFGNIMFNRKNTSSRIKKLYSNKLAKQYISDLESHILYKNDESSFGINSPYCVAIQSYPFLTDGLKGLGGLSAAPENLDSFCGIFINLIFAVSSQFAGAIACLHKDQKLLVNDGTATYPIKVKDLVNSFELTKNFENYQGEWEYADVDDKSLFVEEDGKLTKVNRVYRRKYSDQIYNIKTHGHLDVKTSKDHRFKVLYRGREIEVKAEDLKIGDTICSNKEYKHLINKDSKEYKRGQFLGIICGDGNITSEYDFRVSVNTEQMFIVDFLKEYLKTNYNLDGRFVLDKRRETNGSFRISNKDLVSDIKKQLIECEHFNHLDKNVDIENTSLDFQFGFLDGLLATDGSFSIGKGFRFSVVNEDLCNTIKSILQNININKPKVTKFVSKSENKKDLYTIHVPLRVGKYLDLTLLKPTKCSVNKHIGDFVKNIDYNREVYWVGPQYGKNSRGQKHTLKTCVGIDQNTDVVTEIITINNDDDYVYEIETESHWYNCGGLITHNCSGFFNMFDYFARREWGDDYYKNVNAFYKIGPKFRELLNSSHYWTNDVNELAEHDFSDKRLNKLRDEIVNESKRKLTDDELKEYLKNVKDNPYYTVKLGDGTRTILGQIRQYFQQVVYSINQPSGARGFQSPFTNFSYFDYYYFTGMYGHFKFPDGTKPQWESVSFIQKEFMKWFNRERTRCVLTFPVETMSLLYVDGKYLDQEYADFAAEMLAEGHSFFIYTSDSPDTLSSCCRLANKIQENTFTFTNGLTGEQTGSKSVISLNYNRIMQNYVNECHGGDRDAFKKDKEAFMEGFKEYMKPILERVYKYHTAYNDILWELYEADMLPVYSAGFIHLNKQYLTLGINGLNEAWMFLGGKCTYNPDYLYFTTQITGLMKEQNALHKTRKEMFNSEFVPAESLGIKNYKWDKADGYWVPEGRNCYTSYFFLPDDEEISVLDKMRLHGKANVEYLDGGSACHLQLKEHLSKEQYTHLLNFAGEIGCNYWTVNVKNSECRDCGYISKDTIDVCPKCGGSNFDYWTRIIGYLRKVSNFSEGRQIEESKRFYSGLN